MKKIISLVIMTLMLAVASVGLAADRGAQVPVSQKIAQAYSEIWQNAQGNNTKVGIIYLNKAGTTFDDDIDYKIINGIVGAIRPADHIMVDCTGYLDDLQNMGINDLSLAERGDIIDVLQKGNLDYAVLVQVNPFVRKERLAMFRYVIEMTSDINLKVVDVKGNKYLYNGKLTEFAKHGTAVGGISNKATVMKVLALTNPKMIQIVEHIPKG